MALPRPSSRKPFGIFLLALAISLSACSDGGGGGGGTRGGGGESGGLDASGKAWIIGLWEGTYENLNAAVDSEQRETSAWLKLEATDERSGTFHLKLPQMEGVFAKGTFTDVSNFRLIFKISESNLSSIGMADTARTFDYELANESLTLRNVRVQMTLTRGGKGGNGRGSGSGSGSGDASLGNGGGTAVSEEPLAGSWRGTDQGGRSWLIKIFGRSRFTIEVSDPAKAMLWMSGVPRFDDATGAQDAMLLVDESAIEDYVGFEYAVRIIAGDGLEVRRLGRGDGGAQPTLETFLCTRQP